MGKSSIQETHTLTMKGLLDTDSDEIMVEPEEGQERSLRDLIQKFNGCNISLSVKLNTEIE